MSGRDGAEGAYEDAYPELFLAAMRLAYRILRDRDAAEDVAAEALARTYARWRTVRVLEHRQAWVLRVAANLAIDVIRRRPAPPQLLIVDDFEDSAEWRVALGEALSSLPMRQREALVLHYFGGLSEVEASKAMGIEPSSVRTHVQRGLAALRRSLRPDFDGGSHAAE